MDISRAVAAVAPHLPAAAQAAWTAAIGPELDPAGIRTAPEAAEFLGQTAEETGGYTLLEEDLHYSAARMLAVWPRHFASLAAAAPYAENPERLANHVYAGELGNGSEASGDGWRFRGRGLIQLTGRALYAAFGQSVGMTPEDASDYLGTRVGAAKSAAWYWSTEQRGLNALADSGNITAITLRINGGLVNLATRKALVAAALHALGG